MRHIAYLGHVEVLVAVHCEYMTEEEEVGLDCSLVDHYVVFALTVAFFNLLADYSVT